jgi:hypothetical protein
MGSFYADNIGTDDSGLRQSAKLRTELEELEAVNVRLSATVNRLAADRRFRQRATWRNPAGTVVILTLVLAIGLMMGVTLPQVFDDQPDGQPPPAGSIENTPTLPLTLVPAQGVVPTDKWVMFYGLESTLNGQPLPVGAVIRAYEPQGVVCGHYQVTEAGRYGLMPVYGDDPLTEVDEGAVPGDRIRLTVNGAAATVTGPDEPVWVTFADLKQVELALSGHTD